MSSLRSKLARLGSIGPTQREAVPVVPQLEEQIAPDGPGPSAEPPGRAQVVASLRQAIARIMARGAPPPPAPADPSAGELPFAAVETDKGTLYVRHVRFEPQHRVGKFPVGAARRADATMLSLLALDPALSPLAPGRALYLDTETTGLSGGTGTLPFLIGLGFFDDAGQFVVEQLLLRRPGEEAPMLERVTERLAASSMLITFNGKAFDMPLVRTRFVMNRLPQPAPREHLDLLHVARRVHRARIGKCSLGAVENRVLGFGRVDDIPSGEVSARYAHFLRTGDESALVAVVEHNTWDVVAMAAIVGLYGEPRDGLDAEDLAQAAATLQRARAGERAAEMADEAVERGGGASALRARAMIAKARGDRDRALADFEALVGELDDPAARLELAKLYEHYCKEPRAALDMVELGVAEDAHAVSRRKQRLQSKIERSRAKGAPATGDEGQGSLPGMALVAARAPRRSRRRV